MRVKVTLNLGYEYPDGQRYQEGEVVDCDEQFGMKLVSRGHGVELPPERAAVKAPEIHKVKKKSSDDSES